MQLTVLDRTYAGIREQSIQDFIHPLLRAFQSKIILRYAKQIKSESLPDIRNKLFKRLTGETKTETTEIKIKIARKTENLPDCFFALRYLGISYRSSKNKVEFYPLFKLPKLYTSRARAKLIKPNINTNKPNRISVKGELLAVFALYDCEKCSSYSNWENISLSNPAIPKSHNACCLVLSVLNNREQKNIELYQASSDRQMEITHYLLEEAISKLVESNLITRKVAEHVESYGLLAVHNRDIPLKLKLRFAECTLGATKLPRLPNILSF